MEKLDIGDITNNENSWEVNFYLTRTHLFVRQILWKLPYDELVEILEKARKNK